MFEGTECNLDYCLGVLAMEKHLYDNGFDILGTPIDEDYIYQNMLESFDNCADEMYSDYRDEDECEIIYFTSGYLARYIKLAHEYGKKHHIRQKDNPWFEMLDCTIHDEMYGIESYCYDWDTNLQRKKNMPICLILYLSPEFFQPVSAVRAISNIFAFVRDESLNLRDELFQKSKLKLLPCKSDRKAA